jgi:hypothetical protein
VDTDIFHRGLIEHARGAYPERDWEADGRIGMVLQRLLLAAGGGGEDGPHGTSPRAHTRSLIFSVIRSATK